MSNILAGVGRGQLKVLNERVEARRAIFHGYRDAFAHMPQVTWMPEPDWSYSTHWLSACIIDPAIGISSQELIKDLSLELIEARPLWKPMHLQPIFSRCRYFEHPGGSVSDRLFKQGICLPSGSNLSELQTQRIVSTVQKILG